MADLFISYSRADADTVHRLCEALVAQKREVWVDWRDIPPTVQWREEIRAAIDAASAVVFVLSPAWVASEECRHELDHAGAQGKRLIPVVLQKPDMAAVPAALAELNWIFLRPEDLDTGVGQLLQAVDTDLAWSRAHAELLRRATAWQATERDPGKLLRGRDLTEAERWLATNTAAPKPVAVQSAYVLASRGAAVRGQRVRVALAIGVAVVAVGLAIWAFLERQVAQRRYQEALSRQLTIESNTVRNVHPDGLNLSVQLAAEAMRRVPSPEAADALRAGLRLLPRLRWQAEVPTRTGIGVAFTPDGAHIATADAVWNAATGAPAVEFGHEGRTTDFVMSPDGLLVARIGGQRLQLWDRAAGKQMTLQATERGIPFDALAFSRDGRRLAAADMQHTVHIWETAGGALAQSLPAPEALSGPVRAISFSPDGGVIAVARRQRVERWETSTWKRLEPALTMEAGAVAAIDYAADGRLAAVTSSGAIVVHGSDGTPGTTFALPTELGRPESIRFSPDGRYLGVTTVGGAQVIDAKDGRTVVHTALGDARHVLTTRIDEMARLWDTMAGKLVAEIPYTVETNAAFSRDGTRVAVAAAAGVQVVDSASGGVLANIPVPGPVGTVLLSHDGRRLIAVHDDDASLFDVDTARPLAAIKAVSQVRLAPSGRSFVTQAGNEAQWLDAATGKVLAEVKCQCNIHNTVFGADGRLAAIVADDNRIYVRALDLGGVARDVEHTGLISQVAFSPDGKLFALTGSDPIAVETEGNLGQPRATSQSEPWQRLVELQSGREIEIEQERAETSTLVFSADGRYLAAGMVVWDATTGRRLTRAEGQIFAFSPDQRLLLTRDDNAIHAWPWRSEDMLTLVCSQLSRNLTEAEWQRYVSREEPPAKTCAGLR